MDGRVGWESSQQLPRTLASCGGGGREKRPHLCIPCFPQLIFSPLLSSSVSSSSAEFFFGPLAKPRERERETKKNKQLWDDKERPIKIRRGSEEERERDARYLFGLLSLVSYYQIFTLLLLHGSVGWHIITSFFWW